MALAGLLSCLRPCPVHLQGIEGRFCPCLCLLSSVPIFAGLAVSVCLYIRKKKRPFVGRFLCGCWFLLLSKQEHCKRLAVSACYCYLVFVCLHPSCRGACNIVQICFIGRVGAALAFIDSYFLFHGVSSYRFKPLQTFSNTVVPPAFWRPANSCILQYFQTCAPFRPSSCIPPLSL